MGRKPTSRPALIQQGWWDRLDGRTRHLLCFAVLLVVGFAFYAPALFTNESLIGGDTVNWRAMAEVILEHEDQTGAAALWAPNAFAGMPGYMVSYSLQVPQIDIVPTLLRGVIWPVSHFLFLLLGTYLLVFYLTRDRLSGLFAAVAYGFTTYMAIYLVAGHNSKFITLCFSPWLLLAFAHVLRKPSLPAGLLFAAALSVNLRAGHVQITYYVAFLAGIWWIVEAVGAARRKEWRPLGTATAYLALGSILGLLMVAQPYLANMEYKKYTIRGAVDAASAGLDWSYAMGWSQGIGELVTLIAADAFGGGSPAYWGPKPFTSGPHYVGPIVLFLAVLGIWRWRRNVTVAFAVSAALMALFSLGSNLPVLNRFMYAYFPLFNAFRVPETWLIVMALATAVLGALGLHAAGTDPSSKGERAAYISAGGVAALLALLWMTPGIVTDFEAPNEAALVAQQILSQYPDVEQGDPRIEATVTSYLSEQRVERTATYRSDIARSLLFLVLAAGVLVLYRRGKLPRWGMQAAIALLVLVDLWGVGRRYFNGDQLVQARDAEEQIATYDFDRFILERQEAAGGMGHFRVLSLETGNPFQNARPSYHFESIGGYHGAKLRLIQDYIDEIFVDPATGGPNDHAMDLLNVRYVIARGNLPGMRPVFQSEQEGFYVLENPDALPRAFLAGQIKVVETEEDMFTRLRSAAVDLRRTAFLYEPVDFETTPIDSSSTARAEVTSYAPDEIAVNVDTDAPRLLVLSEVFYPAGWRAEIDGESAPIIRTDHLLRGVPVPEGSHEVVLRFAPSSHTIGVWVAGISTALVYGMIVVLAGMGVVRRRESAAA